MAYLVTAATDFEMRAFTKAVSNAKNTRQLVTGLGLVETTLALSSLLHEQLNKVDAVLNFGVAGAYPENGTDLQAGLLDICLAEHEILGDLGICLQDGYERFTSTDLRVENSFIMDQSLLAIAGQALDCAGTVFKSGTFITVNCASGTRKRGQLLGREFHGLCENMEGAAVARVCRQFGLSCLEVRCISNMVEDRDMNNWQLKQACTRAGQAAATIVNYLMEQDKK